MTTQDKNKLIAEWDGWELHVDDGPIQLYKKGERVTHIGSLKYSKDWNLLMDIVEKIESMNMTVNGVEVSFDVIIEYGDCNIKDDERNGICDIHYHSTDSRSKIEAVHECIYQFILWYNKNKTQ